MSQHASQKCDRLQKQETAQQQVRLAYNTHTHHMTRPSANTESLQATHTKSKCHTTENAHSDLYCMYVSNFVFVIVTHAFILGCPDIQHNAQRTALLQGQDPERLVLYSRTMICR